MPNAGGIQCCYQIAGGANGFLVLATRGSGDDGPPTFLTSADGVNWIVVDGSSWPGGFVHAITGWGGRFLAAGINGPDDHPRISFWVSEDGRTWQAMPDAPELQMFSGLSPKGSNVDGVVLLSAQGERIEAIGERDCTAECDHPVADTRFVSSNGGITWKRSSLRPEYRDWEPAVLIGDDWVRVSEYRDNFEMSLDKKTWIELELPVDGFYTPGNVRLRSSGAIAVGGLSRPGPGVDYQSGLVLLSTDGKTWTQSIGWPDLDSVAMVNDVAESGSSLVAIGFERVNGGTSLKPVVLVSPPID